MRTAVMSPGESTVVQCRYRTLLDPSSEGGAKRQYSSIQSSQDIHVAMQQYIIRLYSRLLSLPTLHSVIGRFQFNVITDVNGA